MNINNFITFQPSNYPGDEDSFNLFELICGCRILVAEDDAVLRSLTTRFLRDAGAVVDTASDGEQAWFALIHGHYDLLIADNDMPCLTGIHLIERIRRTDTSLPVVIASGAFSVETSRDYPHLQINAVISKPFGRLELLNVVKSVLSSYEDTTKDNAPMNRFLAVRQRSSIATS
jgi:DNA-binding response OmpR family regulator